VTGRLVAGRGGERGTTILEMALIMPVLLLMAIGLLDFGRAVYVRNELAHSARDAARLASIDPANTACIRAAASKHSSLATLTAADITITRPSLVAPGQPVTVAVQSKYQPVTTLIAGAIGASNLTLKASATMQIRNVPDTALACP
jgi:Flp pilus assembly protein TadG